MRKVASQTVFALLLSTLVGIGCAADPSFMETEDGATADALTSTVAPGSLARTKSTANFRPCASTSSRCSPTDQLTGGTQVVLVTGRPENGFYKVQVQIDGSTETGYVHGNLLVLVAGGGGGGGGGGAASPESVTNATMSCNEVAGAPRYATDRGNSRNIPICRTSSGAIWFKADFDVDCDGGSSASCRNDPDYQSDTSAHTSSGRPLDASTMNFVVIPLATNGFNFSTLGVRTGTVAAVVYRGRISYGIVGDLGPTGVVGEGSAHLAQELGMSGSPTSGGAESGVTYVFFPNVRVTRNEDQDEARRLAEEQVRNLM
jgi:hypothetical protein